MLISRISRGLRSAAIPIIATSTAFLIVFFWYFEVTRSLGNLSLGGTQSVNVSSFYYGIMFDAGSTGSRMHVFKFDLNVSDGGQNVVEQMYTSITPGLSAYANQPHSAADSLRPLLDKALDFIPKVQWNRTIIALKATAGLRLLTNNTAQRILSEVRKLFSSYPFRLVDTSVTILQGKDEGVFSWFTVNLLHGLLDNSSATIGMMDLGGGSTQITFVPFLQMASDLNEHIVTMTYAKHSYTLYSRSYLGLGINSVRFQTLGGKEHPEKITGASFRSVCLPNNYTGRWKHGGHLHTISNARYSARLRYRACSSAVRQVVSSAKMDKISHVFDSSSVFALSYFVDRALSTKLIGSSDGGVVTVADFYEAALHECDRITEDDPFLCLDLCYISVLLQDGYGLKLTSKLHLKKRINNWELAWPLGALMNVYGKFIKL